MTIRVDRSEMFVLNMRTRFPFRYGIASLEALPHLFVRVTVLIDGKAQLGIASEGLAPKWFTKNPDEPFRDEIDAMLRVIRAAADFSQRQGEAASVFEFWRRLLSEQQSWGEAEGFPPLLWSLGVSLMERAVLDAFCRATDSRFADAVRCNTLGIDLGTVHPELSGLSPGDLLPAKPRREIFVRHTVGLADPLVEADIQEADRCDDGLPQSLAAGIKVYDLQYFKIKLCGDADQDIDRLRQVADIIQHATRDYAFTLDGNEQYQQVEPLREVWNRIVAESSLAEFLSHLIFVEQPIHRDKALAPDCAKALLAWQDRPPMIIDESDALLGTAKRALESGYVGTSHKNCKGVIKSIVNACLIEHRRRAHPEVLLVLSGEDLANVGPIALLQDLAVVATLGIDNIERNGHHYFAGLSQFPTEVQQQVLNCHADLYRLHHAPDRATQFTTLKITQGTIALGTVVDAPFGTGFELDSSKYTPLDEWDVTSLDLA